MSYPVRLIGQPVFAGGSGGARGGGCAVRRLILLACLAGFAPGAQASGDMIYITGATVIYPDRTGADAVQPHSTLVIEDGRIEAVYTDQTHEPPSGVTVLDGTGKFVIPGLVDSHVHFFQSGSLYTRPD